MNRIVQLISVRGGQLAFLMKDHLMCHFLMICPTLMMINSGLTGIED
jgi:hypothetical protein